MAIQQLFMGRQVTKMSYNRLSNQLYHSLNSLNSSNSLIQQIQQLQINHMGV